MRDAAQVRTWWKERLDRADDWLRYFIWIARNQKMTLREIAELVGLSHQRVAQLAAEAEENLPFSLPTVEPD